VTTFEVKEAGMVVMVCPEASVVVSGTADDAVMTNAIVLWLVELPETKMVDVVVPGMDVEDEDAADDAALDAEVDALDDWTVVVMVVVEDVGGGVELLGAADDDEGGGTELMTVVVVVDDGGAEVG